MRKIIIIFCSILILTGCNRNNDSVHNTPIISSRGTLKEMKTLSDITNLIFGTNFSAIYCSSNYNVIPNAKHPDINYNIYGYVKNASGNHDYNFTIGTESRHATLNASTNKYQFSSTTSQITGNNDSWLFGGTSQFKLTDSGQNVYADQITVPKDLIMSKIDISKGRGNIIVNWTPDPSNSVGIVASVSAYADDNSYVDRAYDLYSDASGTHDISSLIAKFPNQKKFTVHLYKGAYYQLTDNGGNLYNLIVFSDRHQFLVFN